MQSQFVGDDARTPARRKCARVAVAGQRACENEPQLGVVKTHATETVDDAGAAADDDDNRAVG